jgi:Domain of unknown function (DUF4836)
MKSLARLTLLFLAIAFLFSSCSKKNEEGKMIPGNAMVVFHLNTKSLQQKLTWDDIKQTSWYKQAYSDTVTTAWMKKLLDNPENSGINLNGGLNFFAAKNADADGVMVLQGLIKSDDDFTQFNKNLDSTATIKKDGDLNMLTLKGKAVVVWDDKHFTYAFDADAARSKLGSMYPATTSGNMAPLVDKSVAMSGFCKSLFSLKHDSSLAANDKFTSLLKENGDVNIWINTEEMTKNSAAMGTLGMLKLDVFLKDNISTYTINFENGKINVSQKLYAGKELTDFLKKYSGDNINTDFIKNIPSQNVLGIFAMSFKPEGLRELVKLTGMDGFLNMYTGQMGFNLDDFVKANKGEILLALTDLSMKNVSFNGNDNSTDTSTMAIQKPDMNFLFSVAIGDKPSFQKLVDAGKKLGVQMGANDTSISYGQNEKYFAISNHQHYLNDYLAANANNKYDFLDKLNSHPAGFFVDIHKILSAVSSSMKMNPDNQVIMDESYKLWNNVYATGGEFKDGGVVGNTEINLIDQSTNSLKQLNHYFDTIAKIEMAKKESETSDMNKTDSMMVPPPIDTVGHK